MLHNTCDKIKDKNVLKRGVCVIENYNEKAFLKIYDINKNVNLNNYNDDYDKK